MNSEINKRLWKQINIQKVQKPSLSTQGQSEQSPTIDFNKTLFAGCQIKCINADDSEQQESEAPKFYIPSISDENVDPKCLENLEIIKIKKRSSEKFDSSLQRNSPLRCSQTGIQQLNQRKMPKSIESLISFGNSQLPIFDMKLKNNAKQLKNFATELKSLMLYLTQQILTYRQNLLNLFNEKSQICKVTQNLYRKTDQLTKQISNLNQQLKKKQKIILEKDQLLSKQISLKQNYLQLLNKQWGKNLQLEEKMHQSTLNKPKINVDLVASRSKLKSTISSTNNDKSDRSDQKIVSQFLQVPKMKIKTWSQEDGESNIDSNYDNYQSINLKDMSKQKQIKSSRSSNRHGLSNTLKSPRNSFNLCDKKSATNTIQINNEQNQIFRKSEQANNNKKQLPTKLRKYSAHQSFFTSCNNEEPQKQSKFKNMSIRLQKMNDELKTEIAKYSISLTRS